jgi:pyruvate dehydrogenase complex dehydrogenase (E1) component
MNVLTADHKDGSSIQTEYAFELDPELKDMDLNKLQDWVNSLESNLNQMSAERALVELQNLQWAIAYLRLNFNLVAK